MAAVLLDTNVFVAAGFNRYSHAARIVEAVETGRLRMVWNEATRRETKRILRQIPRLKWDRFADLFQDEDRFDGLTSPEQFAVVPDPEDRKFAALAAATSAVLITSDDDLLGVRDEIGAEVLTSGAFSRQYSF